MLKLATENSSEPVQVGALDALSRFTDDSIATAVLSAYPSKVSRWRVRAGALLLSRASWARRYLEAIDHGKFSADEVSIDQVGGVALLHDPALDALVRKHWGTVKGPTPEERLAEVRRLNNDLRAAAGDSVQGRKLFMERCATCHRFFGEGNQVGPDLTHANRKDRDYLLVSLVDPSGVIRKEYQSSVVALRDGRVLTGLIADQTQGTLTLVDSKGERMMVNRGEIEAITESASSLMPENLYKEFSPPQLRDLFSFLQSDGPAEGGKH